MQYPINYPPNILTDSETMDQITNQLYLLTLQSGEVVQSGKEVRQQSILSYHQPTVFTDFAITRIS